MFEAQVIPQDISGMSPEKKCLLNPGAILNDKWLILDLIGKGAMGEVYRAHQLNLRRDVAIKIISKEWLQTAEEEAMETETIIQRFHREFEAMAKVRHPNVLQIYDYGVCSTLKDEKEVDIEYIAMEYVPGATLRFTMSDEGFEPDEKLIKDWILEYFMPVLDGIQAVHNLGIVHRDLKPENVLLDGTIPKITDFGLARSSRLKPLSQTVDSQGTLMYMPPEQFVDFKRVDQRGDIFSLGRILYEALTGKISKETIPFKTVKLSNPTTPFLQKLDQIIQRATAEDREQRLSSVEEMRQLLREAIQELEAKQEGGGGFWWARTKWIWGGIALVLVAVLGMTLWHLLGNPGQTHQPANKEKLAAPQICESPPASSPVQSLPKSIVGEDGMTMALIPGGSLPAASEVSNGSTGSAQMKSFYMDETRVTAQNFAEFLNEVKKNVLVENGAVKNKGKTWFLMGQGTEPYEYIIFEHGRFHLRDPRYAPLPVVRVTWQGALAYARHYKERLPSESEWKYALSHSRSPSGSSSPGRSENRVALRDMEGKIFEWAVRQKGLQEAGKPDQPAKGVEDSVFLGKPDPREGVKIYSSLPQEEFRDVGFRCVVDIRENGKVEKKATAKKKVMAKKKDVKKKEEPTIRLRLPWEYIPGDTRSHH
jgi:serine/threonine protein kinase